MKENLKNPTTHLVYILGLVGLLILAGLIFVPSRSIEVMSDTLPNGSEVLGSGGPFESVYYDAIGTPSSPDTLTTDFSDTSSTVVLARGLNNVVIGGTYTPKTTNANLYIQLERSLDDGNTFIPYSVLEASSDDVLVYSDSGATTTALGVPFTVPGDLTSTSGTAIGFSFDLTMAADYLRIGLAEQNGTSTAGTANLQVLLNSN